MNTDQVRDLVQRHLKSVLEEWDSSEIDSEKSMSELGVSSLDLVDVLSGCMRELKVKIPWTEITKLNTVNEIVHFFSAKLK